MDYGKKNDGFDAERKNGLREGFGNGNEQPNFTDNGNEQPSFFDFSWDSDAYAGKTDKPEKTIGSPTDEKNEKTSEKGIEPTYEKEGEKTEDIDGESRGKIGDINEKPQGKFEDIDGKIREKTDCFSDGGLFSFPENGWGEFFARETRKEYFANLTDFLRARYSEGAEIYPPKEKVFECFRLTDRKDVKVVILGQDPYHQPMQAMGLSFSVPDGVKVPPSLVNIFKEIRSDLGREPHIENGDLRPWAEQGVLLLNSLLTVEKGSPMAHKGRGWETFTDNVIKEIGRGDVPCVFLLWGRPAAAKSVYIDRSKHLVLTAAHPSPLSAYSGFFGCRHFSAANDFLAQMGIAPISW